MRFIERLARRAVPGPARLPARSRASAWAVCIPVLLLAACAQRSPPSANAPSPLPPPGSAGAGRALPPGGAAGRPARPVDRPAESGAAIVLPPPGPVSSMHDLRLQAARRLMAANPNLTYGGLPPDPLLAIPVLEIELNVDGSVRKIDVLRQPSQARDTTQLAIDAVHRAAPFGQLGRVPKPWKFVETFLFNDARRFKPMTLDR